MAESAHYIWSRGLAGLADAGYRPTPEGFRPNPSDYLDGRDGDVLWVRTDDLPWFLREIWPRLNRTFVLVTGDSDISVPGGLAGTEGVDIDAMLADSRLCCWFTQNYDDLTRRNRLYPVPIGMDFHTIAEKAFWGEEVTPVADQEKGLKDLLIQLKATGERIPLIYSDLHLNNSSRDLRRTWGENRLDITRDLNDTGLVHFQARQMRRSLQWKIRGQYAFSLSAPGNGLDCHRTWESLVLGNIVVTKSSTLDPLYDGLPVVTLTDWKEITRSALSHWLSEYRGAFSDPAVRERLTCQYWINRIRSIPPRD